MAKKPKGSSTPKIVPPVKGRGPIHSSFNEAVLSPINKSEDQNRDVELRNRRSHFDSSNDSTSNDSNESDTEYEEDIGNITPSTCINSPNIKITVIILLVISALTFLHCFGDKNVSLEEISKKFPGQVDDFWLYIRVGIEEISKYHQPKTFIFLYNDESQKTLNNILEEVSNFAVCTLTNCLAKAIVLHGSDLNASVKDYGEIITRNRDRLEESGVMIIKNLEQIHGVVAQAFHSFCDEYNPVVENALLIFTMKVDKYPKDNLKFLEQYLRNLWNDLDKDKFDPLFTRISGNVFPIKVVR